jgi:hypothetical protein
MRKETQLESINAKIMALENKQREEIFELKIQAATIYDSLRPLNLIKKLFTNTVSSPDIKHNVLNNAVGLATGFLSKKLLVGASLNPVKILLGNVLQFALGNLVARNADNIKSVAENLIKKASKNGVHANEEYPDEYIY